MKFKDQCDLCMKFDYCKGFDEKVLCEDCIRQQKLDTPREITRRSYMNGIERIKVLASEIQDKPLLKIIEYLLTRQDMNDKYLNEDKNLSQMVEFIKSMAKQHAKNGVAMIEDAVVFGWAIHYWDESNEKLKLEKAKEETTKEEKTKTSTTNSKVKKKVDKNWNPEGQLTLFDMM